MPEFEDAAHRDAMPAKSTPWAPVLTPKPSEVAFPWLESTVMVRPIVRCWGDNDALLAAYHDKEWGRPVHDDRVLFEHLALDGFQAGLSWRTILHKREAFREAFANFDPERVARYRSRELRRMPPEPIGCGLPLAR